MNTPSAVDDVVRRIREQEARRGLRAVNEELTGVVQDFGELGEERLAQEAKVLKAMAANLLHVVDANMLK